MKIDFECPVCGEGGSLEIADPDAGSQEFECSCGSSLEVSYTVTAEVDSIGVVRPVIAEYQCPRCGDAGTLEITEESGQEEVTCVCDVTLSVSWSGWGRETTAEVRGASMEYTCPECDESSTLEASRESGEEEVECACGATLSVSWTDWGSDVQVQVVQVATKSNEGDENTGEEDGEEVAEEEEEGEDHADEEEEDEEDDDESL